MKHKKLITPKELRESITTEKSVCSNSGYSSELDKAALIYPCVDCGKMRSQNQGGTTFTVCDECWDKRFCDDDYRG